ILEIRNRKGELQQDASLIPDCNLLRLTNNAVYKDIGWGHEAYALEGLPAIEAAIGSNPGYQALLEGFRLIDRGRRLSESARNSAEGQDLIWRGNVQLLWHEQAVVIQPFLKLLSLDYDRFLTALTVLTYWTSPFQIHPEKMTAFYLAMVAFGKMMLARTRSLPNFRNLDQRW